MQNRIEFINYYTIKSKSNKHASTKAKQESIPTATSISDSIISKDIIPQGIYSFSDDKFQITMHDNVTTNGSITRNANIKFSIAVKNIDIIPKQKLVCEHDFYFNYSTNTIVIGKIKNGTPYECVKISPINNNNVHLYSLLYNLPENSRKACGQCNGSLYILITYYIINFIISKGFISPITTSTFTLYDNAVKTNVKSNSSIQSSNIKLSVEQLIKYSRTYYEAFGFLPHIIYTKHSAGLHSDTGVPNAIAPTDANYLEYFNFLVKKRKDFLNMTVGQIKALINNSDPKAIDNFWKINNGHTTEYLLFINITALKEIMHNAYDNDTIKLNKFLATYPDIDRIHSLFFLPESVKDIVIDKRVIRIYTPQSILENIIKIYKDNDIQIYEPYFRTVKLI